MKPGNRLIFQLISVTIGGLLLYFYVNNGFLALIIGNIFLYAIPFIQLIDKKEQMKSQPKELGLPWYKPESLFFLVWVLAFCGLIFLIIFNESFADLEKWVLSCCKDYRILFLLWTVISIGLIKRYLKEQNPNK